MKQHLELPDGKRIFHVRVCWGYKDGPQSGKSFECNVIAESEEQAINLAEEACLFENPSFRDHRWLIIDILNPILLYY